MRDLLSRSRSRDGFAIGVILLAVVLIAAIISAIALASRGSFVMGDKEKNFLLAQTITNQATNYKAAYDRLRNNGATQADIYTHNQINPFYASRAGWVTSCTTSTSGNCLFDTANGGALLPAPHDVFAPANQSYMQDWMLWRITNVGGANAALSNRLTVLILHDIKLEICTILNNQYQPERNGVIPTTVNIYNEMWLGKASADYVFPAADSGILDNAIAGSGVCFSSDNGGDVTVNPRRMTYHLMYFLSLEP
jgi:hypothetical protein